VVGTEANPAGSPSAHLAAGGVGAAPSAKGAQTLGGIRVGAWVQVAGRRGRFRVVGLTGHGVELRDPDERWHAVRPEAVRVAGDDSGSGGATSLTPTPSQDPRSSHWLIRLGSSPPADKAPRSTEAVLRVRRRRPFP
jgi:hypothetical protein